MKRVIQTILLLLLVVSAAADDSIRLRSCNIRNNTQHALTRSVKQNRSVSYIGHKRQLVVLAAFADVSFVDPNPLQLWGRIFNEEGFAEDQFIGSVHDYFYDQSYGKLNLQFDLQYVRLNSKCAKYASTAKNDDNSQYLVYDIVDSLTNRGNIDWSTYDWDDDGNIDQIIIIYAGKGQNDGGGTNTIWPHHSFLTWHTGGHTKNVTSGGKDYIINRYCCIQERKNTNSYGSFGTICHEYSHCFNLPDIYAGKSIIEYWDLMDAGNYNADGFKPCNYSAFERMLMGWIDIQELTTAEEINNIPALSDEPKAYLVRNDGYSNEFYIIENRQKKGWDANLPGSGLVIFHIDYDKTLWDNLANINANYLRYTIIPANNNSNVSGQSGWAYPYVANDSLTNLSVPAAELIHPNTDNSLLMSKPITKMRVVNGLASFHFMDSTPTGISTTTPQSDKPEAIYDLYGRRINASEVKSGLYIIKYKNGETKKVVFN